MRASGCELQQAAGQEQRRQRPGDQRLAPEGRPEQEAIAALKGSRESEERRGTCLSSVFPQGKSVASRTAQAKAVCHHRSVVSILIVDDDQRFRSIARKLLESEGFDVVGEAGRGEAALAVASELEPDVVLLDVHLPDLDGFEVAARISAGGGPSVIMTSTRDESDFGAELSRSGARGFVPKDELSAERIASLCE